MVAAYQFVRGTRNRPLLPHRQLAPIREMLLALAEQHRATALQHDGDDRWLDSATALEAAADALKLAAR